MGIGTELCISKHILTVLHHRPSMGQQQCQAGYVLVALPWTERSTLSCRSKEGSNLPSPPKPEMLWINTDIKRKASFCDAVLKSTTARTAQFNCNYSSGFYPKAPFVCFRSIAICPICHGTPFTVKYKSTIPASLPTHTHSHTYLIIRVIINHNGSLYLSSGCWNKSTKLLSLKCIRERERERDRNGMLVDKLISKKNLILCEEKGYKMCHHLALEK